MCVHSEVLEPLRSELGTNVYREFEARAEGLPLLDSFIKESARISCSDASKHKVLGNLDSPKC